MTAQAQHLPSLASRVDYNSLAARFRPIFARIAAGTVARAIVRALQQGKLGTQVIASAELQELGA